MQNEKEDLSKVLKKNLIKMLLEAREEIERQETNLRKCEIDKDHIKAEINEAKIGLSMANSKLENLKRSIITVVQIKHPDASLETRRSQNLYGGQVQHFGHRS
jgi:hypothetical protein